MKTRFIWSVGCGLIAAWACTTVLAQSPAPQPPAPPAGPYVVGPNGPYVPVSNYAPTQPASGIGYAPMQPVSQFGFGYPVDGGKDPQTNQLAKQFVKTDKEDEKKEIRKKLTDVLNNQFDLHVQQQQKELEELEKQIANLRTVLKKRVDAKASIVDRRFEQLVQDAQGLGWNVPNAPRGMIGSGSIPQPVAPTVMMPGNVPPAKK